MLSTEQNIQSSQYRLPYHYLPQPNKYWLTKHWSFAPSYLAALDIVECWLAENATPINRQDTWRHVDLGCGDGALIHFLASSNKLSNLEVAGIDFDDKAVQWASLMNKGCDIRCGDIGILPKAYFDSATLIEVLEHIPTEELNEFVAKSIECLRPGGLMLVTVPSIEKALQPKHYQHFDFESIQSVFPKGIEVIECRGFESISLPMKIYQKLFMNSHIKVDFPFINRHLINYIRGTKPTLSGCGRILVKLVKN